MPWVNDVPAIVQAWYSGNEAGNALADIIYGKVNPSGRLPLTLPVREQDTPAYLSTKSENGKIHYREDLFVGYKWYHARDVKPLFAFGYVEHCTAFLCRDLNLSPRSHGLSYTTFSLTNLRILVSANHDHSIKVDVMVDVKNTGSVAGSEVVQVYMTIPDCGLTTPKTQLRGFTKAKGLAPNSSGTATISLDKYALSYWDERREAWKANVGTYVISVGRSSDDILLSDSFQLHEGFEWVGL